MNRFIYIFLLIVALCTGCAKTYAPEMGETVTINYSLEAPQTKALGEGEAANYVWYGVYRFRDDSLVMECEAIQPFIDGKALCPVTMTLQQDYKVLFIAQHYENVSGLKTPTYIIDAANAAVSMPASGLLANSENNDMFAAIDTVMNFKPSAPKPITLKRRVAMINFWSSEADWSAAAAVPTHSSITISGIPSSYNLLTGEPSQTTMTVDFAKAPIISAAERHVASAYCLVGDEDLSATLQLYTSEDAPASTTITVDGISVAENRKTQIIGNMIND